MEKILETADLKQFITTRASRYSPHLILEGKLGKAFFDFSSFGIIEKIVLVLNKLSGNGKFILAGQEFVVHSRSGQILEIPGYNQFEVTRKDGVGEIGIVRVHLYYQEPMNWKSTIKQAGKTSMINLSNGKLSAAVGGTIEGDNIESIITSPPDMAVREGNVIKFVGQCEILAINILNPVPITPQQHFEPREAAPPVHQEPPPPPITNVKPQPRMKPVEPPPASQQSLILFDTQSTGFSQFRANFYDGAEFLKNAGKDAAFIKQGGTFLLPISNLLPNRSYIVMLNGKKLNGNGKLSVSLISENDQVSQDIIFNHNYGDQFINLRTGDSSDHLYKLRFAMNSGPGEILVCRVQILEAAGNISIAEPVNVTRRALNLNTNKRFVIVIPSYNNVKWCQKNIESVLNQNYEHFRIIFTDDASSDGTFEKVQEIVKNSYRVNKCTLIKNQTRLGALQNLYNMIHSCDDDEIILTLDGDDWFPNVKVLSTLEKYYVDNNIWLTYGQYQNHPDKGRGISSAIPDHIIKGNSFRSHSWCSSHLRTFYAWLFKCIKKEDLMENGQFFSMTWDMAMMFPMLEMAGDHSKFISEVLYIYNLENPINDHKVNVELQRELDRKIRAMPRYSKALFPVSHGAFSHKEQISIGLMIIATGKYHKFIQGLITSADANFLTNPRYNVTYYIFSEKQHEINSKRQIKSLHIDHRPFPYASMDRFAHFTKYASELSLEDYIYYIDVDCLFVDKVEEEILGNLVGVRHCGFIDRAGPVENKPNSVFYVDRKYPKKYNYYFGGGFSGGRTGPYLELANWCATMIDKDVKNGIMPIWHDETALNRYFLDHEPDVILTPSYHYPQSDIKQYKAIWGKNNFHPRIILLEKKHDEVRV